MDRGLRGEWGKAANRSGLPLGGGVPSLERGERRPLFTMATSTSAEIKGTKFKIIMTKYMYM